MTVSQAFLVFGELKNLRSISQVLCRISFNLGLSDISVVVRQGFWGLGEEDHKGKVPCFNTSHQ